MPIRFSQRIPACLAATSLAVCAAPAQSTTSPEDSGDVIALAPFTVTAEASQSILQITQRDLDRRQAQDLEDALSIDPSITVGGSTGIAQKIYVRNLGEGLINVSIDGATQSGSLFHHVGRIAVEPDLLKQVEVQPGVGNATDGPGALGGAIRFVTKDPEDLLAPDQRAGALVKYGWFSNTRGYRGSATVFARLNEQWSALAGYVYSEHEDIEDGAGNRLDGSNSRQKVALAKLVGRFGSGHSLRLGFEHLDEKGDKLRRPEWAPGPANPSFYMEAGRSTFTSAYGFRPDPDGALDLAVTLSHTEADILQIATFGPYAGSVATWQLDVRNTQRIGDRYTLVYGVDHRADEVAAGPDTDPKGTREDSTVSGVFFRADARIDDRLSLSAGARVDAYRLDDRQQQSFDEEGFSPSAGITYDLTSELSLSASAATAFRGAQIADAFRVDIRQNAADLQPEKAQNYEVRLAWRRSGFQAETGAYANRIDDVVTNTLPWSRVYGNAGKLETDGVFARLSHGTAKTYLSLQYNRADTTINGLVATRYQYSSLVSRIGDTWVADASWRPFDGFDVGWNARLVQGIDDIEIPESITEVPGGTIDKPGYVTHDFYARWSPAAVDGLTVSLTVKNVFDKLYLSHGSLEDMTAFPGFAGVVGAPEPGRDIRVSISYRF
ncbi:TonB-dependent receptor domain-containing protein [Congregicoccus parvus]|uniref:TonB-dependent receptor domain-containing protein n=1 Tax=Congregicoccus parvus TaxID=3081749 RepID=UPI003FA5E839